jgi:hypothetical protein
MDRTPPRCTRGPDSTKGRFSFDPISRATEDSNPDQASPSEVVDCREKDADPATQEDATRREVSASGDAVEVALAKAIEAEVATRGAGWEARVALLAGELRARRRARDDVPTLNARRRPPA